MKAKLNRKQLLIRRRAALLSELETAAGQVLGDVFAFEDTAVTSFLEQTRQTYLQLPVGKNSLADMSIRFGLAAGQTLMEFHHFTKEMVDLFLIRLVQQGQANRGEHAS